MVHWRSQNIGSTSPPGPGNNKLGSNPLDNLLDPSLFKQTGVHQTGGLSGRIFTYRTLRIRFFLFWGKQFGFRGFRGFVEFWFFGGFFRGQHWSQWLPIPPGIIFAGKKCWTWWIEGHFVPLYVRKLDFRTYIDFSGLSWLDFSSRCVPGMFLWAGSPDPWKRIFRGNHVFRSNLLIFRPKFKISWSIPGIKPKKGNSFFQAA